MQPVNQKFELEYEHHSLNIEEINLPGQVLFRIIFPDETPPLVILRATNFSQEKFWTSMPEGRQKLAEKIGPLIEHHYRAKV